jgi:hypothetical protein
MREYFYMHSETQLLLADLKICFYISTLFYLNARSIEGRSNHAENIIRQRAEAEWLVVKTLAVV